MGIPFSVVEDAFAFVPEVKDPRLDYPLIATSLDHFDTRYCSFDEPEDRDKTRPTLFSAQCLNSKRVRQGGSDLANADNADNITTTAPAHWPDIHSYIITPPPHPTTGHRLPLRTSRT